MVSIRNDTCVLPDADNEQHRRKGGHFYAKTKLQNIIFTLIMAFVMVYGMVCYNIAIEKGGMANDIFLIAFHEMPIMWPIAFILEFL